MKRRTLKMTKKCHMGKLWLLKDKTRREFRWRSSASWVMSAIESLVQVYSHQLLLLNFRNSPRLVPDKITIRNENGLSRQLSQAHVKSLPSGTSQKEMFICGSMFILIGFDCPIRIQLRFFEPSNGNPNRLRKTSSKWTTHIGPLLKVFRKHLRLAFIMSGELF